LGTVASRFSHVGVLSTHEGVINFQSSSCRDRGVFPATDALCLIYCYYRSGL